MLDLLIGMSERGQRHERAVAMWSQSTRGPSIKPHNVPMRIRVMALALALAAPCLVSACGEQQPTTANRGDCGPSIRFHGVVYINNTAVNQAAPKGRTIGRGTVLDCDLTTAVDTVVVSRVKGADRHQTISVRGRWHGVYVAKDLPHAGWPAVVRAK